MENSRDFYKKKSCWFHSYTKLPTLVEHCYDPINNQSYTQKTYECIICGSVKIIKEVTN